MGASYTTIESQVEFALGNRSAIAAQLPTWIDQAYREVLMDSFLEFYELDTSNSSLVTVASQRTVSLATITDLWFVLSVRDETNELNLRQGSWKRFEDAGTTEGKPIRYDRFGGNLELDPIPDGAYSLKIRYRKRVPVLASGGSSLIGDEFDQLIISRATAIGWGKLQQYQKAGMEIANAERLRQKHLTPEGLEDQDADDFSIQVRVEG